MHLTGPRQSPELVEQMACEQRFMLFTNILLTYYFKNLIYHSLWLTKATSDQ